MVAFFQKEETLKRISDAIDSFQFLVRDGANEDIRRRLELSKLEYAYLQTIEDDYSFVANRHAFLESIDFLY